MRSFSRLVSPLLPLALASAIVAMPPAVAQIVRLDGFDPPNLTGLCAVAVSLDRSEIWVYACSAAGVHRFAPDGTLLGSIPRPGESANDVDLEVAPEALTLGTTVLPAGTLIFINGESGVAEIYALDPSSGTVLASLTTAFGASHVVGGAYDPFRQSFFLLQDRVAVGGEDNTIAEIDPVTGALVQSFSIGASFDVNFGDLEVSLSTGNLFVVSSVEHDLAEFTPEGVLLARHALPPGVAGLSGIALACAEREAWVSDTFGNVTHLGEVPCLVGTGYCTATANSSGAPAHLSASGTASASAGDLVLLSTPVPDQPGIFFHGANQVQLPFGNGFLCASGNIVRGAVVAAASNQASYAYDGSDSQHSLGAFVGSTRNFQHWFRDPMGGGALFNTSDATAATILP